MHITWWWFHSSLRATSHTRQRAGDQYTSSTFIGGKGIAGPSSLHTMLEGPAEYTSECKMDVESTWIPTWHRMDHVSCSLGLIQKPFLGGRPSTKLGDHGTPNAHSQPIDSFHSITCEEPHEEKFIEIAFGWGPGHMWLHTTLEDPWPHYMMLEVCWDGLRHFLLGSHSFMVTTLHSCVKWPSIFLFSHLLLIVFMSSNLTCKFMMKHQQQPYWKRDLPFIDYLN